MKTKIFLNFSVYEKAKFKEQHKIKLKCFQLNV